MAVSPESDSGFANSSVPGMIAVSNTGDAPVSSVSIWCYDGDEVADTTNVVVSLAPGETKDVPFTWYAYTAGEATLNCKPLCRRHWMPLPMTWLTSRAPHQPL